MLDMKPQDPTSSEWISSLFWCHPLSLCPYSSIWNGNVSSVSLYVGCMCFKASNHFPWVSDKTVLGLLGNAGNFKIKEINSRAEIMKLLQENRKKTLQNINISNEIFWMTVPKHRQQSKNRWIELQQMKRFCATQDTISSLKKQCT